MIFTAPLPDAAGQVAPTALQVQLMLCTFAGIASVTPTLLKVAFAALATTTLYVRLPPGLAVWPAGDAVTTTLPTAD